MAHNRQDLHRLSLFGVQHQAVDGIAPVEHGEKWKSLASKQMLGNSFLLEKTPEARQQHCALSEPSPTQNHRVATPYQRVHQPDSHGLPCPGNYLRLHPIQLMGVLFYNGPHL